MSSFHVNNLLIFLFRRDPEVAFVALRYVNCFSLPGAYTKTEELEHLKLLANQATEYPITLELDLVEEHLKMVFAHGLNGNESSRDHLFLKPECASTVRQIRDTILGYAKRPSCLPAE